MVFFIIFVVFAVSGWSVAISSNSVIGQSFYIPTYDLQGDTLRGGYQLFEHIPDKCIGVKEEAVIDSFSSYFKDTATFYKSLSTDTSLDVSVNSLGATLDATTKSVSGNSRDVSGLTYTHLSKSKNEYLEQSCLSKMNLERHIASSFENLPLSIDRPSMPSGWFAYETFLKVHGSHYVTQASYGSSLYQHAFSESSASYTKQDFSIKACVAFAGTTGATTGQVNVCQGVTSEQKSSASSLDIKTRFVARGGSSETRTQLYKDRSDETIARFLGEAQESDDPISYKFTPIWQLLSYKYQNTEQFPKVKNLRSYYLGFLGYPCYNSKIEKTNPTFMIQASPKSTVFNCVLPNPGSKHRMSNVQ
ncbi:DELTA-thalatoxin-Avl2a-like [Amphiura filiformis]|uniref:DELTA-thalatoxin-Avl2a-like n=1 Tax=Amphiura filiformis TaxID=82378 RepID=UPI003B22437B